MKGCHSASFFTSCYWQRKSPVTTITGLFQANGAYDDLANMTVGIQNAYIIEEDVIR